MGQLLKEVRVLTDLKIIAESRDNGTLVIRGTFQRANAENQNKRVYPRAVLENSIKRLDEKLKNRELVGELDHPAEAIVKLQNASHLITKLEWDGDDLIGEAEILPTPAGQIAKSLIQAGVKIGISSRGVGTLSENSTGSKIVNDDYNMVTFDIVADPSTQGAFPSIAESKQHAIDFVNKVIKPALSEKAFLVMLKNKLNESTVSGKGEKIDTGPMINTTKGKDGKVSKKWKNSKVDPHAAEMLGAAGNRKAYSKSGKRELLQKAKDQVKNAKKLRSAKMRDSKINFKEQFIQVRLVSEGSLSSKKASRMIKQGGKAAKSHGRAMDAIQKYKASKDPKDSQEFIKNSKLNSKQRDTEQAGFSKQKKVLLKKKKKSISEGSAGVSRLRRKAKAGVKINPSKKWYKYTKEDEKRSSNPEGALKGIKKKMSKKNISIESILPEGSGGLQKLSRKVKASLKGPDRGLSNARRLGKRAGQGFLRAVDHSTGKPDLERQARRASKVGSNAIKKAYESYVPLSFSVLIEGLETRGEKNNPFKGMTRGQYKSEKQAARKEMGIGKRKSIKDFTKGRPGKGALPDARGGRRGEPSSEKEAPMSLKQINRAKGNPARSAMVAKKNEKAIGKFMSKLPEGVIPRKLK